MFASCNRTEPPFLPQTDWYYPNIYRKLFCFKIQIIIQYICENIVQQDGFILTQPHTNVSKYI